MSGNIFQAQKQAYTFVDSWKFLEHILGAQTSDTSVSKMLWLRLFWPQLSATVPRGYDSSIKFFQTQAYIYTAEKQLRRTALQEREEEKD